MKKKGLVLSLAAMALVLTASVGTAFGYFSTYATAKGGYTISLGDYEEITEDFQDWKKTVVVTSRADSNEDVYVRVKAFAGSSIVLTYESSSASWTAGADGYYYYSGIIAPGASTDAIDVKISNIPNDVNAEEYVNQFNVIVVYECTAVEYNEDGTAKPADWSKKLDVTQIIGADTSSDSTSGGDTQ